MSLPMLTAAFGEMLEEENGEFETVLEQILERLSLYLSSFICRKIGGNPVPPFLQEEIEMTDNNNSGFLNGKTLDKMGSEIQVDRVGLKDFCQQHRVLTLYLFGSYLKGKADKFSDLDLGILFFPEAVEENTRVNYQMYFLESLKQFFSCRKQENQNRKFEIDLVFMQRSGIMINFRIVTSGEVLFSADEEQRKKFEDYAICRGLDFKFEQKLYDRELRKNIRGEK